MRSEEEIRKRIAYRQAELDKIKKGEYKLLSTIYQHQIRQLEWVLEG